MDPPSANENSPAPPLRRVWLPFVVFGTLTVVSGMGLWQLKQSAKANTPEFVSPIQRVLELDRTHFAALREKQQLWNPANPEDVRLVENLASTYWQAMTPVDLSACPPAFRRAFQRHLETWEQVLLDLNSTLKDLEETGSDQRSALSQRVKEITAPLGSSWERVQDAARQQGIWVRT